MQQIFPLVENYQASDGASVPAPGTELGEYLSGETSGAEIQDGHLGVIQLASNPPQVSAPFFYANAALGSNLTAGVQVFHRKPISGDCTVSGSFQMVAFGGTFVGIIFREAGVCARVQGGSYVNATQSDARFQGHSFYWARLHEEAAYPAFQYRLQILKVVNTTVTVLAQTEALDPIDLDQQFGSTFNVQLTVEDDGANVNLTAGITGVVFLATQVGGTGGGGLIPQGQIRGPSATGGPATGGPFTGPTATDGRLPKLGGGKNQATIELTATDTSSPLQTTGRCGLIGQRDAQFGNSTGLLTVSEFAVDNAAGSPIIRDLFKRDFTPAGVVGGDLPNRVYGGATQSLKSLCFRHEQEERHSPLGTADGRLEYSGSGTGILVPFPGGDAPAVPTGVASIHSYIPARRDYGMRKAVTLTVPTGAPADTKVTMQLLSSLPTVRYDFEWDWGTDALTIYSGATAQESVASATTTLDLNTSYVIEAEAVLIGSPEAGYIVQLRAFLDGVQLQLTAGSSTNLLETAEGGVLDTRFQLVPPVGGFQMVVDVSSGPSSPDIQVDQIEDKDPATDADTPNISSDPDELAAYSVAKPTDGATGTLALEYEFAVDRTTDVRRTDKDFSNGQVGRMLGHVVPRRKWELRHDAMTETVKDQWQAFWDAHRNEVPFTFTALEDSGSGTFRFMEDTLEIEQTGPVYSLRVTLEEVFS